MPGFAAFCAAWSLAWAIACFAHAGFLARWMDAIEGHTAYWGVLLTVQALACTLGLLAARAVG